MTWTDPRWLWLAAAALLGLAATPAVARRRSLQQARLAGRRLWSRWLGAVPATGAARLALWLLAAAAAAIAAAGPRWGNSPAAAAEPDIAIALDVSASMRCADVSPERLGRATSVLCEAIDRVGPAGWALASGAGTARASVPLTSDARAVAAALASPELGRGVTAGSNLAVLLATAASLLDAAGPGRVVLLVSDGEELEGDAATVAAALRRSGIAVVALATGTAAGGPVPRPAESGVVSYLRDASGELVRSRAHPELLARLCGGAEGVVDASAAGAPAALAAALRTSASAVVRRTGPARSFPFGLGAALLATASFMLWPWRRRALAAVLLFPGIASAAPPVPTARTESAVVLARRATAAMERGAWAEASREYAAALALRPGDADLRLGWGTAAALAGETGGDEALAALAEREGSAWPALYNLGTARLARGNAAGAVDPLRRAVAADPARPEGWRNLELALAARGRPADRGGDAGTAAATRARLVEAAARAALVPFPVKAPAQAVDPAGRSW